MIVFRKYRKVALTLARELTQQDFEDRNGVVVAPEGILTFTPGDYLAKDAKGEWTIWASTMRKYVKVSEAEDGFAYYLRTDTSFAAQMPDAFTIDGMQGKANDYLVMNDGAAWPVDCEIFEQSYKLVEDAEDPIKSK